MQRIEQVLRFLGTVVLIIVYLASMPWQWLTSAPRWQKTHRANRLLSYFSRVALKILNVRVNPIGLEKLSGIQSALYVGNHLSYVDVVVLSSRISTCFVTSTEIKNAPVLGWLCRMAGCLFVERRNRMNIHNEISELSEGLRHGLSITIFPEATSTNGEKILRFRKPLYVSAIDSGRPIVPFCLNYRRVGGEEINLVTRDSIFWYGDMDFVPHLWALCGSGGVEVDVVYLDQMDSQSGDATALTERSQIAIEKVFRPVKKEGPLTSEPSTSL